MKLITIVLPVYNREKYIEECLNSVLEQTYKNFEIVIVDDGSTDNTLNICNRFAQKDNRIKILVGEHKGVSAARNLAIDNAEGDWLFFLDSDDVIHSETLELLSRSFQKQNIFISIIKGENVKYKNWEDYILLKKLLPLSSETPIRYTNEQIIEMFFSRNSTLGKMGGFLISKNYIGTTRFRTNLHIGEDIVFIYENLLKGTSVEIFEQRGYFWRTHDNNASFDVSYSAFMSRLKCKEILWKSEEKFGRFDFSKKEKIEAFNNFINTLKRRSVNNETKKICIEMHKIKKDILPALTKKMKFRFIIATYFYWLFMPYSKIKKRLRKLHK